MNTVISKKRGVLADEYTLKLLDEHLPSENGEEKLVHILQSWIDEDDGGDQQIQAQYLSQIAIAG